MNASLKICIQPVLNNSIGSDLVSISTTRIKYAVQVSFEGALSFHNCLLKQLVLSTPSVLH